MIWLVFIFIVFDVQVVFDQFLVEFEWWLVDLQIDCYVLVCEVFVQVMYGCDYVEVFVQMLFVVLNFDVYNVIFEVEYYMVIDQEKFVCVKLLLWLWKNFDLMFFGQNLVMGILLWCVLVGYIFKWVGCNFKCWQNVEFLVGYNMEVGDDVVVYCYVLFDDIGGIELYDGVLVSDYVNIYSYIYLVFDGFDVMLCKIVIGWGVCIIYYFIVFVGSVVSDDVLLVIYVLLCSDILLYGIVMGILVKVICFKQCLLQDGYGVDVVFWKCMFDCKVNFEFFDFMFNQICKLDELLVVGEG